MRKIDRIFIHTAAHGTVKTGVVHDTTAAEITQWHLARGFDTIGYHFVIRFDGGIELGRSLETAGAHVKGVNARSVGICLSGHGDIKPPTDKQMESLLRLVTDLCTKFNVPVANVLGHKEVNKLIADGKVQDKYRTDKSCPGKFVDMNSIRMALAARLG